MSQEALAFVEAADRIEVRSCKAIRWTLDPIRNHNAHSPGICLIQCTNEAQEVNTLGKRPIPIQSTTVEAREWHPPSPLIFHFHQLIFQLVAFEVLVRTQAMPELLQKRHMGVERAALSHEWTKLVSLAEICTQFQIFCPEKNVVPSQEVLLERTHHTGQVTHRLHNLRTGRQIRHQVRLGCQIMLPLR